MRVAIRRWGDKCFHLVDEEVEEGYIMDGHLIRREDVIDRKELDDAETHTCGQLKACPPLETSRKETSRAPLADEPPR